MNIFFFLQTVKLVNSQKSLGLPAQFGTASKSVVVYQERTVVVIERLDKQFRLECNLKYNFCTVELSGWYFGKTAGLFGTMNNEAMDDLTSSNGQIAKKVGDFASSWTLNPEQSTCTEGTNHALIKGGYEGGDNKDKISFQRTCRELFRNASSEFASCFMAVPPNEYGKACVTARDDLEACAIIVAYMQACSFENTHLRIPDK